MELRRVRTIDEYRAVESIQRVIWGMVDEPPVPLPILVAMNSNGGLVEVAKDDEKVIGFSLAFPGNHQGSRFLYSHMAGVLEEYRNKNIGYEIKVHQFEEARKMGYSEVRWTFDPMKTRNSFFNVHKLGAYAYDYKINYYGIMGSRENEGVESDRIEAHKFLDREKVVSDRYDVGAQIKDFPKPWKSVDIHGKSIAIEVPLDLGREDLNLAKEWRLALRSAITTLEGRSYVMNDVVRRDNSVLMIFTLRNIVGLE